MSQRSEYYAVYVNFRKFAINTVLVYIKMLGIYMRKISVI